MGRNDEPDASSSGGADFTTRTSSSPSSEHEDIGPYRILELVGTGGMGEVYRAEQVHPIRRTVALKIIKRGMDTKEVIARFEAERQALALMDHPNIARVFEAGSTPHGRPYFAMEYVKGIPITKYCDEHKLSVRERLALFIQLCEGVQHAHQKAIIHRDLKPSNVLVTIQENKPLPKIIDFGVAKATAQKLTEKTMYTALGEMIGTPDYMSPEQATMTSEDIDTRTDVYALGVILYELLAGALPFEPKDLRKAGFEGIVRMIREKDPPRPSTRVSTLADGGAEAAKARRTIPGKLNGQLRGDLDWITMRALEKDRTRRYGSPSELAADVRRHLHNEPVLARPPSAAYRTRKFVRRHTVGVGVATAGVVVLVGFAITMAVQANRIARERDRADQEAETSNRVSEFLVSVFKVSDPDEARGNTVTAREVLDNGATRIRRELADEPLLRAKMMDTMGRVYQNLGLFSIADTLLTAALKIRRDELGEEHLDTVDTMSHLGRLRMWQGNPHESAEMLRSALAARERELGAEHVDTAWSLYYLGSTLVFGRIDRSEGVKLLERALSIFEREFGVNSQAVSWCLNDIGSALSIADDNIAALPYFERALDVKKATLPNNHEDVGMAEYNVGNTLKSLNRLEEARPHLEAAHEIIVKSVGTNHFKTAVTLQALGDLYRHLGKFNEARRLLQQAEQAYRPNLGEEHWFYADLLHDRGLLERDAKEYEQAESFFQRCLEIREKILPHDDPDLAETLEEFAVCLRRWAEHLRIEGRADEANTLEKRARRLAARAKAIREKLEQSTDVE